MLSFDAFFDACSGLWTTERTYHTLPGKEVERSYTEFRVNALTSADKQQILAVCSPPEKSPRVEVDLASLLANDRLWPGFSIAFDTRSETGETVSMSLRALFIPDAYMTTEAAIPPLPIAAQVATEPDSEIIQGYYLRDEGYSESGAIAGRFTYQPTRQTLEMTTAYRRSVAVDQMRLISPTVRLRTIVTYQRPATPEPPSILTLIGFGLEQKQG